ncbi:hypothetical protein ACIQHE_32545, partial [Burkholderia vietnamiensis]|uniref:hypothetical protein n=1 Tax=Burkholderia vietnamiensis TaxID=60552 RepID=UPI00382E1EB5
SIMDAISHDAHATQIIAYARVEMRTAQSSRLHSIVTGPTLTNVNDFRAIYVGSASFESQGKRNDAPHP